MAEFSFKDPLSLRCPVKSYAWGKKGQNSLAGRLSGLSLESQTPYAELWLGAHKSDSASLEIASEDLSLAEACQKYGESMLGADSIKRFGSELPFLAKVLSIDTALSIQAHPTLNQAENLHRLDPEHYPDSNHKPEVAVALSEVELLWGIRPFGELRNVIAEVPEFAILLGQGALKDFVENEDESQAVRSLFSSVVKAREVELGSASKALRNRLAEAATSLDSREQWILRLAEGDYPSDIGLFFFYLLNFATLAPGEALFTDAGVPHAYLSGELVECMANSDNVVRLGLTPKYKDSSTLLDIMDYSMRAFEPLISQTENTMQVYRTAASEFELSIFPQGEISFQTSNGPEILFSIDGRGRLIAKNATLDLQPGSVFFVSAEVSELCLELSEGLVFRAAVPPLKP